MKNIAEYLKDKYGPWGWMGQRAHDAEGINRVLPLDFIISCDFGQDVSYFFREGDVFSVEKEMGIRKNWSNEDLNASFKGGLGKEIFRRWNSYKRKVSLLCYRSIGKLEKNLNGVSKKPRLFAVPERIKRRFDNKILLFRTLPKLSLSSIPGVTGKMGKFTFGGLRKELPLPFVVQLPYGSSGQFTFMIREKKEFSRLSSVYSEQPVVIRKYINGFSINSNALVVSSENGPKVCCATPSIQITGAPECSNYPSAFCGNDYASARLLSPDIVKETERCMSTVGLWMAEGGFRGAFGMDFVVKNGNVYPVEINPRFQNSTSLRTVLNLTDHPGRGMFFLLHIAEFLQRSDKTIKKYVDDFDLRDLALPLNGSQVILHNGPRRTVVTGGITPGIFNMKGGKLILSMQEASLAECRKEGDILVTCAVPKPFTVIEPGAPICKVQMRKAVLNRDNLRRLSPETAKIVRSVYEKIGLRDACEAEMAGTR